MRQAPYLAPVLHAAHHHLGARAPQHVDHRDGFDLLRAVSNGDQHALLRWGAAGYQGLTPVPSR